MKEASEDDNKMLAAQLRQPNGDIGIEVAKVMNDVNKYMIEETIDSLGLCINDTVLEIGHGNGYHIKWMVETFKEFKYQGLDISETMHKVASNYCESLGYSDCTDFTLYNGLVIPFPKEKFNKIFTVDTLYFWLSPVVFLNEIHRVLKPGGKFSIGFVTKNTLKELAFTEYGFDKYDQSDFSELVTQSNFNSFALTLYNEEMEDDFTGELVNREYFVAEMVK